MSIRALASARGFLYVLLTLLLSFPLLAQDDPPGPVDPPGEEKEDPDEKEESPAEKAERERIEKAAQAEKERREAIAQLFAASKVEFDDKGRVVLTYDFTKEDEGTAMDFSPDIDDVKKRMRWSRGWEGNHIFYSEGIVVNKIGAWLHKAIWTEVDIDVHYGQLSEMMKKTDIIAAVYSWDDGKTLAGSNLGSQCIRLKGLRHAKSPIPRTPPTLLKNGQKVRFGMTMKDGVLTATRMGRPGPDTSKKKSFLKKLAPGRVGVAWNGQWVKGVIMEIKITGTLDPEWLAGEQ